MLTKQSYRRKAHALLPPPPSSSTSLTSLRQAVQGYLSQSLHSNSTTTAPNMLIKALSNQEIPRREIIQIWNTSIEAQLSKWCTICWTLQKKYPERMEKLEKDVSMKIDSLCMELCRVQGEVDRGRMWCQCGRTQCPKRLKWETIAELMKKRCFQFQRPVKAENINYVSAVEDQTCELLTLDWLQRGCCSPEAPVVEFLKGLKINKERGGCQYSKEWLEGLGKN